MHTGLRRIIVLALILALLLPLSLRVFAEGTVTVIKSENGSVTANKAEEGDYYTIKAIPEKGYRFKEWVFETGSEKDFDVAEDLEPFDPSVPEQTVLPKKDVTLKAVFEENFYRVTLGYEDLLVGGSFDMDKQKYAPGDTVTISAFPSDGFKFLRWITTDAELNDPTSAITTFTMPEKDVTVNAEFEYITYYFRLEAGEGGTAFVRDQSPDAYGRYGFHAGDVFDLEAECGENYLFAGWKVTSGVEIDNWEDAVASILCPAFDFTVQAQFASSIRTLTIVSTEGGSVSPQEGELRLGSGSVLENLLAIPEEGWVFSGWESSSPEGYFKDPKNPATDFTMPDEDCTVTARFVKGGYRLWLAATAGGTVNGGIAGNYEMKMQIPLQATPGEGYEFSHWESDVAGVIWDETAADTVLTMPGQSVSVTAVFVLIGGSPAATEPDETKKQETRNFPWAALLIVLFLSAIAITLIVVREQFNLSYRYLIRKLIWKENDGDDDDNER